MAEKAPAQEEPQDQTPKADAKNDAGDDRNNARVEDGMLIIEARKEQWKNPAYDPNAKDAGRGRRGREFADYTSASLTTRGKASWTYGRIEVRAKLPSGRGTWPAIWMLGTNSRQVRWPACGEIDIMVATQAAAKGHNFPNLTLVGVVDADLNFYTSGMYNHLYWQRISPKEVLPSGVPLYDDASLLTVDYAKEGPNYTYDLAVNPADGGVFMYAGADIKSLDKTGLWPITYWTREGKLDVGEKIPIESMAVSPADGSLVVAGRNGKILRFSTPIR